MSYEDKSLTCQDCGRAFVFTATQQSYLASKGLTKEPRRGPTCRDMQAAAPAAPVTAAPKLVGIEPVQRSAEGARAKDRRAR